MGSVHVSSGWLTAVRVRRLGLGLRTVPGGPPGLKRIEVLESLWRVCGGPLDEANELLDVLLELDLAADTGSLKRTKIGNVVAKAIAQKDHQPLAEVLIRSGCFHDQARILIENGRVREDGALICPARTARSGAPQLLGVLTYWEEIELLPEVRIPQRLLEQLTSIWALTPPPAEVPTWAKERQEVGNRAESYTVQDERMRLGPTGISNIVWVARDNSALGYDVEDRSVTPHRCIEVKGSRDSEVLFFLSDNEWNKAQSMRSRYIIHFWGEIDLRRDPATEFLALKAAGYPKIINDIAGEILSATPAWSALPVRWKITPAVPTSAVPSGL